MRNPFRRQDAGTQVIAPCEGRLLTLDEVPDPVFASRVLGDGFAVDTASATIVAPVAGELVMVAPTGHAFAVRADNGAEVLVHIGVDTVKLRGEGFQVCASAGERVDAGAPVVQVDVAAVTPRVPSMVTIVVVTNKFPITMVPGGGQAVATIGSPN